MNISHQEPTKVIFENLDPVKLKRRSYLPSFRNPLINLPIAQRLVFGFLIPALIAALAASIIGVQSVQLLNQESGFYQNLFQSYSSLTTGNDFLQLMNFKLSTTINDTQVPNIPHDQLIADRNAVQELENRYDVLLQDYVHHNLLIHDPNQATLFDKAGHPGQAAQQNLLASSTVRTWKLYRSVQDRILQDVQNGLYQNAQTMEQQQGQLTYSDALSALRQLIQFNGRLTTYVQDATNIQQTNTLITTWIAVLLVILVIGVIGWLIYGTIVGRLHQLRKVTQAVQQGHIDTRAAVDGRDEITDVSTSVNTMLDTIVGLLEQTRVQHDALISAAERLFSDMRLANGGEFDVRTAVNNDPIWMLGHAFNFTIGRFRRFVTRNQTVIEQLDVVSQQGMENVNVFLTNTRKLMHNPSPPSGSGNMMQKGMIGKSQESITGTSTGLTSNQAHELTRLNEGFARDVTGFAQSLRRITEDMRSSLAPFRLDTTQSSSRQPNPISTIGSQNNWQPNPISTIGSQNNWQPNPISEMGSQNSRQPNPISTIGSQNSRQPNPISTIGSQNSRQPNPIISEKSWKNGDYRERF